MIKIDLLSSDSAPVHILAPIQTVILFLRDVQRSFLVPITLTFEILLTNSSMTPMPYPSQLHSFFFFCFYYNPLKQIRATIMHMSVGLYPRSTENWLWVTPLKKTKSPRSIALIFILPRSSCHWDWRERETAQEAKWLSYKSEEWHSRLTSSFQMHMHNYHFAHIQTNIHTAHRNDYSI